MLEYALWALVGTLYGTLIGIIPVAGVTTALITVFTLGSYFMADPYLGLVFLMAIVASCAAADSYTSILTGIPGASATAAIIIDGHPMVKNGEASRAMGISIFDSLFNGLFWACATFFTLPYYGDIILKLGVPEFVGFMFLSLATVGFVVSSSPIKSLVAIAIGLFIGLIGQDPGTGIERFTFGWDYLEAGIGMVVVMSGVFAVPELIWGYKTASLAKPPQVGDYWSGIKQGFNDVITNKWDVFRGGLIGFVSGLLPGVGGAVGDFLAYGATKNAHKDQKFGNGNPLGLLGTEGANNAQKVSSMIPTMLFGIPAAPFAAMIMAICMYMGIELGSPFLLYDEKFIQSVAIGYIVGGIGVALISLVAFKYIIKILEVPFWIYAAIITAIVIYANMQYTGGWEDLAVLAGASILGIGLKYFDISRPAVLVTFVVAGRLEAYTKQTALLYDWTELLTRPVFMGCMLLGVFMIVKSVVLMRRNSV